MTELRVDLPRGETCPAKAYLMRMHGISGSLWKRIKHHGAFTWNGSPAIAARTMVKDGDHITYDLPVVSTVVPEALPLSIVYEDDDLLVLDKPAGQLVHPTTKETRGTIANAVRGYYAACGVHLDVHPRTAASARASRQRRRSASCHRSCAVASRSASSARATRSSEAMARRAAGTGSVLTGPPYGRARPRRPAGLRGAPPSPDHRQIRGAPPASGGASPGPDHRRIEEVSGAESTPASG